MLTLFLLPVLFICGLVCFISPSKFISWVYDLLPMARKVVAAPTRATITKRSQIDKAELEMVFATFDKNGDGSITKLELKESLENLGLFVTKEQISTMVEKFDSNQDGLIDLEEFCALYESMVKGEEDEGEGKELDSLKEAFNVFDENGDGLITAEELGLVMTSLGLNRGAEDCKNMIKKADKDGDGKVNFEEFKLMMQSRTSPT
ncbi:calmodulin-like protein 3 [Aristolochia californica]|uniref:calmodulin-like protein 3 n=1 Tax=Aristolochia californica TaxID=171875 RepID=UPI0035D7C1C6